MALGFESYFIAPPPEVPYTWRETWNLKLADGSTVDIFNQSPRPDNYSAIHESVRFLNDRFKDEAGIPALFKESPVIRNDELKMSVHYNPAPNRS
ncbi:MAG: hypothetical protein DYH13_01980 [Alphaproteobacteria bacterium PRO2]|nr:hypothetical protein [Alphaproteobacteria bacterium PRO2]